MRKSLEEIQSKHQTEMEALQQKVDDAENRKDEAETQFQQLLERVNIIKSQLGERLKEDEVRYNVRAFLFFISVVLELIACFFLLRTGGIDPSKIPDRRTRRTELEPKN